MSQTMTPDLIKMLSEGIRELNFDVTEEQIQQFNNYYELLMEWNEKMNLTAITEPEKIVTHHFLDSISCAKAPGFFEATQVLDMGTGAGFPGIPLQIMFPRQQYVLMDSLAKRVTFLETVIKRLGLEQVKLYHARAEQAGRNTQHREQYRLAVSRAVAALPVLLEYVIPLLKVGGRFICQKGPRWREELDDAEKAMKEFKVVVAEIRTVDIPYTDLKHTLIVFQKTGATSFKYPRRPGIPSKKPL
ncbi:16S rRNA (guanine(527)-N(7))-methyltransferase RsmG [Anoxynatronum buryatiense]|uniref:Ribosomal RNA small subunit methyltransferase G n=1 Tax=Anoxynatronum buryatiense TaxID=489973 RepID=A0AA45WWA6_9CLOT|nr:16S rRNA (guanine(527)-N(7))-methyltransferase RsmG [Anoxynatronum buryatiense]SMP58411.1 16S rRNA m(7)G-527 methyltransferase [Anoxynatronum buryatiense]